MCQAVSYELDKVMAVVTVNNIEKIEMYKKHNFLKYVSSHDFYRVLKTSAC